MNIRDGSNVKPHLKLIPIRTAKRSVGGGHKETLSHEPQWYGLVCSRGGAGGSTQGPSRVNLFDWPNQFEYATADSLLLCHSQFYTKSYHAIANSILRELAMACYGIVSFPTNFTMPELMQYTW